MVVEDAFMSDKWMEEQANEVDDLTFVESCLLF
jgi:hypothetical protein